MRHWLDRTPRSLSCSPAGRSSSGPTAHWPRSWLPAKMRQKAQPERCWPGQHPQPPRVSYVLHLAGAAERRTAVLLIGVAVLTVALSWTVINTVCTLRVMCNASRPVPDGRRSAPPGGSASGRQERPGSATATAPGPFPPSWTWPPQWCRWGGQANAAACQRDPRLATLGGGQGRQSHRAHHTSRPSAGRHPHQRHDGHAIVSGSAEVAGFRAADSQPAAQPRAADGDQATDPFVQQPGSARLAAHQPAQSPTPRVHGRGAGPHSRMHKTVVRPGRGHRLPPP